MHVRSSMRAHSPLSGSSVNGSCAQDTDQKHGKHPQCRVSRHEGEEMEVLVPRKVRPNHRAFGVLVAFDESEQPQVVSVSTGVDMRLLQIAQANSRLKCVLDMRVRRMHTYVSVY